MRNMSMLAAIFPTGDTIATDYQTLVSDNINYWNTLQASLNGVGIGYLYEYNLSAYGPGVSAPWMQHFFMQSLGLGSDTDPLSSMTAYNAVRHWMYRGAVGILGDSSGFCFNYASDYNIAISATDGMNPPPSTFYPTWADVYSATYAGSPPACANTLQGTSAGIRSGACQGYWGYLLPAIAYVVDHNATGAIAAWNRLTGTTNWSDVHSSCFNDYPMWGIVPLSVNNPAPPSIQQGTSSGGVSFR
jgi:hypothetical protein